MSATFIAVMKHQNREPFIAISDDEDQIRLRVASWMFPGTEVLHTMRIFHPENLERVTTDLKERFGAENVTNMIGWAK